MPRTKMTLNGKIIVPILIILAIIVGVRASAILQGKIDPELKKALVLEITSKDLRAKVAQIQKIQKSGGISKKISSMQTMAPAQAQLAIQSVRTTKSIFEFSTSKRDVIAEVTYTIGASEVVEYYRFEHAPGWKSWRMIGKSSKTAFYLHLF